MTNYVDYWQTKNNVVLSQGKVFVTHLLVFSLNRDGNGNFLGVFVLLKANEYEMGNPNSVLWSSNKATNME